MSKQPNKLSNPSIPLDSTILVTGVNGLIGSHVADQILSAGYRVRGTVRSLAKSSWAEPLFASRHGEGRFELFEVPDLAQDGVWDKPMKGVAGIVSVAGLANLTIKDVDAAVKDNLEGYFNLFRAAKAESTVKAMVFTSTVWAAWTPKANTPAIVTEDTYNEEAVRVAADPTIEPAEKGIAPFMAAKVKVEKACWDWITEEKPSFTFNSVLLDCVFGPILNSKDQSASTAGMIKWIWTKENLEVLGHIAPQWFIDARDVGRLYTSILTNKDINREGLYGCASRFSFPQISEILKGLYPERKDGFANLPDAGRDQTEVPNDKAEALLKNVGQAGWTSLEEAVKANFDSFSI